LQTDSADLLRQSAKARVQSVPTTICNKTKLKHFIYSSYFEMQKTIPVYWYSFL
jgi:hypothetical protein